MLLRPDLSGISKQGLMVQLSRIKEHHTIIIFTVVFKTVLG